MPCALEYCRKSRVLALDQGQCGQVLFSRPDIAFKPKASLFPVAAAKALISAQRAMVRQKSVLLGSGGHGEVGVS